MAMLLPVLISFASPGAALAAIETASGAPPGPSPAIIAPDCPVGAEQLSSSGGLAVCVREAPMTAALLSSRPQHESQVGQELCRALVEPLAGSEAIVVGVK